MTISADRDRCVGAGMCVLTAPAVFDQATDDGRVVVRDPHPGPEHQADARLAAESCPSAAITVTR